MIEGRIQIVIVDRDSKRTELENKISDLKQQITELQVNSCSFCSDIRPFDDPSTLQRIQEELIEEQQLRQRINTDLYRLSDRPRNLSVQNIS